MQKTQSGALTMAQSEDALVCSAHQQIYCRVCLSSEGERADESDGEA